MGGGLRPWACGPLVALCLLGCAATPPPAGPASRPEFGPLVGMGRGPVLPLPETGLATGSEAPAPLTQVPFAAPAGGLAVYDAPRCQVFYYPAAGRVVANAAPLNPGQYFFDDQRDVLLYDAWREELLTLVRGIEVGGFAFAPSFDSHQHLYFLGTSDPGLAAASVGDAYVVGDRVASWSFDVTRYATPSSAPAVTVAPQPDLAAELGKPRFLSKINALGALHGGLTSINVDGPGDLVVFTTRDGGVYLYLPGAPRVSAVVADAALGGCFHATGANIDPTWGRYLVWQDTRLQGLVAFDRLLGEVEVLPYARLGLGFLEASAPLFFENDPYDVVFIATFAGGELRLEIYNLLSEQVRGLAIANLFTP